MFDFAWSELALIAAVGLIVIGPKDLPRVLRMAGFWARKARAVAHEFQGSLEQMVRESELDDVRKQVEKVTRFNVQEEITKHIDPRGEIHGAIADPLLTTPLARLPDAAPGPAAALPSPTPARQTPEPEQASPPRP
jgi:sec-independent protein translocase protein TatB